MIYWIFVIVFLLALLLARVLTAGRQIREVRTVLLDLPCAQAWDAVHDFPALHAAHTRGRPGLVIEETARRAGHEAGPGAVFRQKGRWRGGTYWADLEVTHCEPPHQVTVRLVRDSLETERGLVSHQCDLTLVPEGPALTKLSWRLNARIRTARLLLARFMWPDRMRARLLDLSLRSVKRDLEARVRETGRQVNGAPEIEVQPAPASEAF